jgi:hypothetical protein
LCELIKMNLDELTNLLNDLCIDTPRSDVMVTKIIHLMHEASEEGINTLTYHFQDAAKITTTINKLFHLFPDIVIHHIYDNKYIIIDWS